MKKPFFFIITIITTVILTIGFCTLCFLGAENPARVLGKTPDCTKTVNGFFECVTEGDFSNAEKYLYGETSLGLDQTPDSDTGKLLLETIQSSYEYSLVGAPNVDGTTAVQTVKFTYFCVDKAKADIQKYTQQYYKQLAEGSDTTSIYDANYNLLESVAMDLFERSFQTVVSQKDNYLETTMIDINLKYDKGEWKIVADDELFTVLLGGLK